MISTRFPVDLHCHTLRSDGNITAEQLIAKAKEFGMEIIAITDHDIRPLLKYSFENDDVQYEDIYKKFGTHVIPGIEISCQTEVEDVHLLCYGCDWNSDFFDQLESFTIESKVKAYRDLILKLKEFDIILNFDEITEKHGISEFEIQKKHIFEDIAEKGFVSSWKEAKKFVKNTPALSIMREKPDPFEVIRSIHRLGGIVILAHPHLIDEKLTIKNHEFTRDEYIQLLIDAGIDGVEVQYSYDKTSYSGTLKNDEIRKLILEKFGHLPLIFTGGSDYHADEVKGISNPRSLGENGMTLQEFFRYESLQRLIRN